MGAGASAAEGAASLSAALAATPEEVAESFGKLSDEQKEKVRAAIAAHESVSAATPEGGEKKGPEVKKLVMEYCVDWQETAQVKFMTFVEGESISPCDWDLKCLDKDGQEAEDPSDMEEEKFPYTFTFTRIEAPSEADVFAFVGKLKEFVAKKVGLITEEMNTESKASPFLREYFKKMYEKVQASCGDTDRVMELAFDPAAQKAEKEKMKEFFKSECKPLLEKSFAKHDTDGGGTLSKEEATLFFANVTVEHAVFTEAIGATAMFNAIVAMLDMMAGVIPAESMADATEEMKKGVEDGLKELNSKLEAKKSAYAENKDAQNAAAFKVIDTSGDGTLQLSEFIDAFEPESKKNKEFMKALGFDPDEFAANVALLC